MAIKILNFDDVPDSLGERFDPAGISFPAEVPVVGSYEPYDGLDHTYGGARLEMREDGLYAEVLWTRAPLKGLTPAVAGVAHERDGSVLKKTEIKAVLATITGNSDSRIQRFE